MRWLANERSRQGVAPAAGALQRRRSDMAPGTERPAGAPTSQRTVREQATSACEVKCFWDRQQSLWC